MTALETMITEAVAGGLRGLTLFPTSEGRFQAATTHDGSGWLVAFDADPVQALQKALSQNPIQPTPSDGGVFD